MYPTLGFILWGFWRRKWLHYNGIALYLPFSTCRGRSNCGCYDPSGVCVMGRNGRWGWKVVSYKEVTPNAELLSKTWPYVYFHFLSFLYNKLGKVKLLLVRIKNLPILCGIVNKMLIPGGQRIVSYWHSFAGVLSSLKIGADTSKNW